jgi:hypothetical protein
MKVGERLPLYANIAIKGCSSALTKKLLTFFWKKLHGVEAGDCTNHKKIIFAVLRGLYVGVYGIGLLEV